VRVSRLLGLRLMFVLRFMDLRKCGRICEPEPMQCNQRGGGGQGRVGRYKTIREQNVGQHTAGYVYQINGDFLLENNLVLVYGGHPGCDAM
jgi:hypothetical protein